MKLRSFFAISFLIIAGLLNNRTTAENVIIKGTAKGAEGKIIILKSYTDNLTFNEQFLGKATIDSSGNFEIRCNVYTTTLAIIHIEYYTGELYLEQNHNLNIEIKNLVFNDKFDKINYNLNPLTCYVKVITNDKNDLNKLVQKLNINYNLFIRDNIKLMKTKNILPKVDTFLMAINDTFALVNNPFFSDYFNYRIASLKLLTSYSNNDRLMLDYFYQKPILYDNIEYLSFLSDYFENYFEDLTRPVNLVDLSVPVNKDRSFAETLDMMGKDTLLKNEKLREIVLLKTLGVLYASQSFNKKAVLAVLKQFSNTSKFEVHQQIAHNMILQYTRYDKGVQAPDFALKNSIDTIVKLSNFKGKYVFLNFYASWCVDCIDELELMKKLNEKYHNQIVFISISVDRSPMKMYYFVQDHKYDWTFLHFNNDYELLENFGVFAYPSFALIGPDGKFVQCPAPKPSDNIERVFDEIIYPGMNQKENKK